MPNLGMGELLILLVIVVFVFGAKRLPQIGEGIGKGIRNLKRGLNADDDINVTPRQLDNAGPSAREEVSEGEVVERT